MTGMEELFPHVRALDDPEQMEEERRLCYVGMTRARERLYLTNARRRHFYGQEQFNHLHGFSRIFEGTARSRKTIRPASAGAIQHGATAEQNGWDEVMEYSRTQATPRNNGVSRQ
jgi:superfamily I DNA/RNA helicase